MSQEIKGPSGVNEIVIENFCGGKRLNSNRAFFLLHDVSLVIDVDGNGKRKAIKMSSKFM